MEDLRDELENLKPGEKPGLRFQRPALVDLLLADSEALQENAPERSVFWADRAFVLADVMRDRRFLASDSMVRAARLKGNVLRLQGALEAADQAFALGAMHLGDTSPERPDFCRGLAVLRWEQARVDEAIGLLQTAAWLFSEADRGADEAVCLFLYGLLCDETSAPLRGLLSLHRAAASGWPVADWLALRCGFLEAALLADRGSRSEGLSVLAATMRLYGRVRDEGETLRALRLEGAARARLGDLQEGELVLEGVRRKQLARRNVQEVVLTSLALGALLAGTRRGREIQGLGEEIRDAGFQPQEGGGFALESVESLEADLKQGVRPWDAAARAGAEFLRRCRRFGVRLEPVPFV